MKEWAARDRLSIRAHRPSAARADVTPGPRPCVPLYVLVWRLGPALSLAVIPDPSDGGTSR